MKKTKKKKGLLYYIPSFTTMVIMVILPLLYSLIYSKKITSEGFKVLTLIITFIFIIFMFLTMVMTAICIINVYNNKKFDHNKKLIWYILLFCLNAFMVPFYYHEYIKKGKKSKDFTHKYTLIILLICMLSITTSIYSSITYNTYLLEKKQEEKRKSEIRTIITSDDNKIEMTLKNGFKKEKVSEYDLYVKDNKRKIVVGSFVYDITNYEEKDNKSVLNKQVEFIKNSKKNVEVYKEEVERKYNDLSINTIELTGKTDESDKCIYRLSTISKEGNTTNIIYVIEVISSKDYKKYKKELDEILNTIKLN